MKKVLITGANSYLGISVEKWLNSFKDSYQVEVLDMKNEAWRDFDFSKFDCVFHVAGITHGIDKKNKAEIYERINADLAKETASVAKLAGVKHFIFMSSISVYSDSKVKIITKETAPKAKRPYPVSKLKGEKLLSVLNDSDFVVSNVRSPIIFGLNCKGNFPRLIYLVSKLPIFPKIKNKRSMIHITNFAEFIRLLIENPIEGPLFPQNAEFFSTCEIVKIIAKEKGRRIYFTCFFNWIIKLLRPVISPFKKLFGDLTIDVELSDTFEGKYRIFDNEESIKRSL